MSKLYFPTYPIAAGENGVVDPTRPYGDIRRYGGVLDGATVGDAAWANCVAYQQLVGSVGALGGKMTLPAGILQLTVTPAWPANVTIEGQGKEVTIVRVSGAVNGMNAHDAGPGFTHQSGRLKDFTLQGAAGALVGIDVNFRDMPRIEKVRVLSFARQGVYFNNCIMPKLDHCLVQNCGGASFAQVEVENSTTFLWDHSYISGGNVTTIAGLAIDKTTSFVIMGGASESTGIPIRLGGKADNLIGVNAGLIWGIDLENPNNGADCYIELGAGWTGAQYQGVTRLAIGGVNESPSGSVTVKYGIKAQNTDTVHLLPNKWGTPTFAAGGVSNIELVGVNNIRWSATPQSSNIGANLFYVRENGAERKDAKPYFPWEQNGRSLTLGKQVALGATPDCQGTSYFVSGNAGLTTVLNILGGGADGQLLVWSAGDANTTLKHNNGGVGNIWLFDQKDHLLRASDNLVFVYDLASTTWRQVGHSVSTLGPGTGDNVLMTNAAGQISFVANGTEATISFNITPKGAGFVKCNISSQFAALRVGNVAGGNWMDIFPNVTGSPPRLVADGADADIDLKLEPKGLGMVNINLPAVIANGGGAAPTLGTIGGTGPSVVAQNGWLKLKVQGAVRFIPLWA